MDEQKLENQSGGNQPASTVPVNETAKPASGFDPSLLMKDPKFVETVKTFAIYGAVLAVADYVIGMFSSYYMTFSFNAGAIIKTIIYGIIISAIGGALFFYFFVPVRDFIKKNVFLSKYINSLFTLLWIPALVGTVVGAVMGFLGVSRLVSLLGVGSSSLLISVAISLVAHLVVYYIYSKQISAKLQKLYPW